MPVVRGPQVDQWNLRFTHDAPPMSGRADGPAPPGTAVRRLT
jgi:hypothetical protein